MVSARHRQSPGANEGRARATARPGSDGPRRVGGDIERVRMRNARSVCTNSGTCTSPSRPAGQDPSAARCLQPWLPQCRRSGSLNHCRSSHGAAAALAWPLQAWRSGPPAVSARRRSALTQPSRARGGRCRTRRKAAIASVSLLGRSGAVGEQLGDALLVQARDVRACAVEFALQLGAFSHEFVAFEQQRLVLVAQGVAVVFDPGPVGLSDLSCPVRSLTSRRWVATSPRSSRLRSSALSARSRHDASCWAVIVAMLPSARAWLRVCAAAMIARASSFS